MLVEAEPTTGRDGDDARDELSDSASCSDGAALESKDDLGTTKDLLEGLVVSQSSISVPTSIVGSNGVRTRQAAPMS